MKNLSLLALICACGLQFAGGRDLPARETVMLPVRDGTKLATDVYKPDEAGRFPVILSRTPYNKDGLAGVGKDGASRGYVFVAQDTRGRFASEGENLPFHLDVTDGHDTVEWVAKQPWCNGKIGTWGGSAVAITQFQMMASGTDQIDAQYLVVGAPNLYDVVYVGGVFRKSLIEDWLKMSGFAAHALDVWVNHPTYDDYWRARDASRHYQRANAPGVHIGGYWDIFTQATIDGFNGYQTQGGKNARGKQKLILGPWTHGVLQERAGELKFPGGDQPPGQAHDPWTWFNHWLKDGTNDFARTPAVTYYVVGDVADPNAPGNVWRTAEKWPPFKTRATKFYLNGDRTLSANKSSSVKALEYTYHPENPAPTIGGIQLTIPAGPMDQKNVEEREDVLVFTSETLEAPVEVTGRVFARLWISTDAPDTDFIVKLCDVYPDGRSFNLCEGALRARFREGLSREEFLEPDKIYPLEVDLWSTSVIFNRGHRIRVQVTSSSAPGYDPNPNTGQAFRASDEKRPARVTVHLESRRASHVLLPVVAKR
jgi:predicted acyl esterase